MSIHKTLHPEELASRHQLSTRYKNGKKKDGIDDEIRGIRMAINVLIQKERSYHPIPCSIHLVRIRMAINVLIQKEQELQEESKRLAPKKKEMMI